jgi:hypothetical protein
MVTNHHPCVPTHQARHACWWCTITLTERDEFIFQLHERLEQAQNHYKFQYDHNHRELEFHPSDWVWLRLLHRPAASLNVADCGKLGRSTTVLFRCGNGSATSPTSCSYHQAPSFMTSSMWGCSRNSTARRRPVQGCCPLSDMGMLVWSPLKSSRVGWRVSVMNFWSGGPDRRQLTRLGCILINFIALIQHFSLRTTRFSRAGGMSCTASRISVTENRGRLPHRYQCRDHRDYVLILILSLLGKSFGLDGKCAR